MNPQQHQHAPGCPALRTADTSKSVVSSRPTNEKDAEVIAPVVVAPQHSTPFDFDLAPGSRSGDSPRYLIFCTFLI